MESADLFCGCAIICAKTGIITETVIGFAPQLLLRAESFPPLTLGLLLLQGRGPLEPRGWQSELRMRQPLLLYLSRVVSLRRQRLATYAASGISQPSSPNPIGVFRIADCGFRTSTFEL